MRIVLGVDGGGTKTLAAVADETGRVLGVGRAEGCNFQGCGTVRAGIEIKAAVDAALQAAGVPGKSVAVAAYGIAGADRDKDFDIVRSYLEPVNPAPAYLLVNDTTIALRAGTRDGVGVALVAGTGSNTMGFNEKGEHVKVGGLGPMSGDYGSAGDLVMKAVVAAFRSYDGRGPKTILERLFCEALGVQEVVDVIEFSYVDNYQPIDIGGFAPLVFQAANLGDRVALNILKLTGRQMAREAISCIRRLFPRDAASIQVVLGGSVLQRGENPALVESLKREMLQRYPQARITKLAAEPLLGAVLFALDRLFQKITPRAVAALAGKSLDRKIRETAAKALPE